MPHFLYLEISPQSLTIYRKETHTGQYINFSSYTPWNYKIGWINSLVTQAKKICSPNLLPSELKLIRNYLSWNGFSRPLGKKLIKKALKRNENPTKLERDNSRDLTKVWFNIPYSGLIRERIVKRCIKKLRRCMKQNIDVKFIVTYQTKKLSFFTNTKRQSSVTFFVICCS